jgi:threonine dehydrogenase-like Zn-dependent dehydrogenase
MDKPVPRPGPSDAVIQTTRALIGTSDSHTEGGGIGPREVLTLGHEAVDVVHGVGSEVRVHTAIEALGADVTFQAAVKATKPGGTVSSTGYFGEGEFVHLP